MVVMSNPVKGGQSVNSSGRHPFGGNSFKVEASGIPFGHPGAVENGVQRDCGDTQIKGGHWHASGKRHGWGKGDTAGTLKEGSCQWHTKGRGENPGGPGTTMGQTTGGFFSLPLTTHPERKRTDANFVDPTRYEDSTKQYRVTQDEREARKTSHEQQSEDEEGHQHHP